MKLADFSMFDRLYRLVLVAAAAVIGGLLLYWLAPDLTPHLGKNAAALWSWFLIIACGVIANWLLPGTSLGHVSHVLAAILASAFAAIVPAAILMVVLDFPVDEKGVPQLILVGFGALGFASVVYLPIYLVQRRLARATVFSYLGAGTIIPVAGIMLYRPLGPADLEANLLSAILLGLIGASSAIAFGLVAHRGPLPAR